MNFIIYLRSTGRSPLSHSSGPRIIDSRIRLATNSTRDKDEI